jgi:hypothetical protein
MTMANFPKGFSGGLSLQGMPVAMIFATSQASLGNTAKTGVYWVDSVNGLDGNPGTYQLPLATIGRAFALCAAYDVIVLKPGHAETITNATAASCLWSVANVSVIGLGNGSARPTFTYTTAATATIVPSANNISVQNCLFVANFADIAAAFTLTTAKDFQVIGNEFRDTSAALNFLATVKISTTDAAADGLTLQSNKQISAGTTANTAFVDLRANVDRLTIGGTLGGIPAGNWIQSLVAANSALIYQATTTKVLTSVDISYNTCNFVGANAATGVLLITTATTHTGVIQKNYVTGARAAATAIIVTASSGFKFYENYYQTAADKSGILNPANV